MNTVWIIQTEIALSNHILEQTGLIAAEAKAWSKHARDVVGNVCTNVDTNLINQRRWSNGKSHHLRLPIHFLWANPFLHDMTLPWLHYKTYLVGTTLAYAMDDQVVDGN